MQIFSGDCRTILATLPNESVHCCVTSPPYFGLRDYGVDGQIGLEQTPDAYVAEMVAVFREVRRVLRSDGTLWLNLGDSYAREAGPERSKRATRHTIGTGYRSVVDAGADPDKRNKPPVGLKPKDLIGIPWRVAFALQSDGWYLRQDIIWSKPNPMPESVTDRCTKAHEYIFLLSKSARYWFDANAIQEQSIHSGRIVKATGQDSKNANAGFGSDTKVGFTKNDTTVRETRNRRSVWTIATQPFKDAHFATFPPSLIEPMILAGCPAGGTVLDPFAGSGTTLMVAQNLGRESIGIELNPKYIKMINERTAQGAFVL